MKVLCCLFSVFSLALSVDSTLKYVEVLFRHGDRTPTHCYPNDPHKVDTWPEGWQQLTPVGMRQGYELGQYIRSRYVDTGFLKPNFTVGDIYVSSSYKDRCIMTANCMLAGLYPPSGHQQWNPAIAWQPVPVHAIPKGEDFMLKMYCPTYDALTEEMFKSDYIKNITAQYQDLIDLMGVHSGYEPTFKNLFEMVDPVYVENAHNLTFPPWLLANATYKRFLDLKDLKSQLKFHTKAMTKIRGAPLLKFMIKHLDDLTTYDNVTEKIHFYAAHDTTINGLLSAMDVYNDLHLIYAAAVFVELHHTQTDGWTVQVHYRNDTTVPPYQMTLPGCNSSCPLTTFKQLTRDMIPDDPVASCLGSQPVPTGNDCPSRGANILHIPHQMGLLTLLFAVVRAVF